MHILTLSSFSAACPFSSNAITTTAAPYFINFLAFEIKLSSPSLSEIELTIGLPWMHFNPDSKISHFDESIIKGTRQISGSAAKRFKNLTIHFSESSKPSSKFISIMFAPFSTCCLATDIASSKLFSLINLLNFGEPVTLVLSPIIKKGLSFSGGIFRGSRPLSLVSTLIDGRLLGVNTFVFSIIAFMWLGVVPQQPPTMLIRPFSAKRLSW